MDDSFDASLYLTGAGASSVPASQESQPADWTFANAAASPSSGLGDGFGSSPFTTPASLDSPATAAGGFRSQLAATPSGDGGWREMDVWLNGRFPSLSERPFERNDATLLLLQRLKKAVDAQDKRKAAYTQQSMWSKEWSGEVERIGGILRDLPLGEWQETLGGALRTLVSLAEVLSLKDVTLGSYIRAVFHLQRSLAEKERTTHQLERACQRADRQLLQAENQLEQQQTLLNSLEENAAATVQKTMEYHRNSEMLKRKKNEYVKRWETLQKQFDEEDIPSIRFEALKSFEQESAVLMAEAKKKEQLLLAYFNLPPDIRLAHLKIAETKQQLSELETKRHNLLGEMALNL